MSLVWVTNIPTPYTMAVWRELAKLTDLRVICMASKEPNRNWQLDASDLGVTFVNASQIRLGSERVLYAPSFRLLNMLRLHPNTTVLDGWESPAFWQARILARLRRSKVFLSYWSTPESQTLRSGPIAWFRRRWFLTSDGVLTPGNRATEAVRNLGVEAHRITMTYGSVDVAHFSSESSRLRNMIEPKPGHRFLYVGQLIQRKNVHALVSAFAQVHNPNDTLTVVGDGPLKQSLIQHVKQSGIKDSVKFTGHLQGEALLRVYAESNTLVLASRQEVWGLVVNEALACGLHVVLTSTCGVSAEVESMHGVFMTRPEASSVAEQLEASRQQWCGAIAEPLILKHTPERTAAAILKATQ